MLIEINTYTTIQKCVCVFLKEVLAKASFV